MKIKYLRLLYFVAVITNSLTLVKIGYGATKIEWWISTTCVLSSFLIGFEIGYRPFQRILDIIREHESEKLNNH